MPNVDKMNWLFSIKLRFNLAHIFAAFCVQE